MDELVYEQLASQGRVTTVVYPAVDEFDEREENTRRMDPKNLYPGGSSDFAKAILPNELLVGNREEESGNFEHVWSSLSGLPNDNPERDERQTYFAGVALAKSDYTTASVTEKGGIAAMRAGSVSTINTGKHDFHAGDLIKMRRPTKQELHRLAGTGSEKVQHATVPFNHAETKLQKRAIARAMKSNDLRYGIFGEAATSIEDFMDMGPDKKSLTPIQEEALGIAYGETLKCLVFMERLGILMNNDDPENARNTTLERLRFLGVFDSEPDNSLADLMQYVLGIKKLPGVNDQRENVDEMDLERKFVKYSTKAFDIAQHSRDGAFMARTNLVVGTALNNAKAYGGTLDGLFGMTKI